MGFWGFGFFQNHRGEDQVQVGRDLLDERSTTGTYLPSSQNPFGAGAYTYQAFDTLTPLQRTLTLNQIVGGHEFGDDDIGHCCFLFGARIEKNRGLKQRTRH